MMATAALAGLLVAGPVFAKPDLIPIFQVQGGSETDVFGINDSELITGSWYDANLVEHGYVGPVSSTTYTTFDDPTDPGTEPRGINNGGYITGLDNAEGRSPSDYIPFERTPDGTITNVTMGGSTLNDLIQGINNKNVFTGDYINSNQVIGYTGSNAQYTNSFTLNGITNTGYAGRGINDKGDIVGWYYDSKGVQHGFLLRGKAAMTIDYPSKAAVSTVLEGINNRGQITGQWTDALTDIHGFIYYSNLKTFRTIKIPGARAFIQPWGINSKGLIAVGSDAGYYIWCPSSKNCVFGASAIRPQRQERKLLPKMP